MALHMISINVNGLRNSDKRAGRLQYLRSLPSVVDVVCLKSVIVPPVFPLSCRLDLSGLVVPLFFIVLCRPLLIRGVILMVVFFS